MPPFEGEKIKGNIYQFTLGLIFILLFLFEFYQIQIQTSHLLIFLGGYMGLVYMKILFLYERKHGTLWRVVT